MQLNGLGGELFNPLTPKDTYSGRTTPLTSKRFILYIYSKRQVLNILNMVHTFFFSVFKMNFVS